MLTHWMVESGAPSSIRRVSSATFTIVVSRIDMTAPMITTTAIRRTSGGSVGVSCIGCIPPRELEGQVALVTGGGRGIGRLIARELADAGMRVAVAARSAGQVEETAREIDGLAVTADVSKQEDVEAMIATVERELGPIDLLVNNAGVGPSRTLPWEEDPADWWHVFEINVLGAYLCSRAVLRGMVERGRGRIVNTGSGASYLPLGGGPRPTERARRRSGASVSCSPARSPSSASPSSSSAPASSAPT